MLQKGLRVAVLVNEIGSIGIDRDLILACIAKFNILRPIILLFCVLLLAGRVAEDDVISLDNGCICCTINQSLITSIHSILARHQIDYLVIEV